MRGIFFQLLQSYFKHGHGVQAWPTLLDDAGVDQPAMFLAGDDYPPEQLRRIVDAASKLTHKTTDEVHFEFGRYCTPHLRASHARIFRRAPSSRELILRLHKVLDTTPPEEVPGIEIPPFDALDAGPDSLILHYKAEQPPCTFLKGLLHGVAAEYRERIVLSERTCQRSGSPHCEFHMVFYRRPDSGLLPFGPRRSYNQYGEIDRAAKKN